METRKIKNLLTGEIITVFKSTDHPNSSYGIPVWVDEAGNDYGQAEAGILPCAFGFQLLPEAFTFTREQYFIFRAFLDNLTRQNWGTWKPDDWPRFDGLPSYAVNQYQQGNGKIFVVVQFDEAVTLPDGRTGKKFKTGGDKNFKPVCERF